MEIPLSQEVQLLLLCARTQVSREAVQQIQHLVAQDLNWEQVISMAARQGVLPLVTSTLKRCVSDSLPQGVYARLIGQSQHVAMRNLMLTHELVSIVKRFEKAQIWALPFKGPTLSALAYGNVAMRQFIDLDILVPRDQMLQARQLLLDDGYRTKVTMSGVEEEQFLHTQLGYDFWNPQKGVSVELHWNLLQRWLSYPARTQELWEHPLQVELAETTVYTLDLYHLLPYLCAHATKHRWSELKWICDVAELIQMHPNLDWDRILGQAEALRSLRMLLVGLGLAEDLLGATLPDAVSEHVKRNRAVSLLLREAKKQLCSNPILPGSWQESLFFLRSREHLTDRWVYLSHLAQLTLAPSSTDRRWMPLPEFLNHLYLVVRPLRFIVQFLSGSRGRDTNGAKRIQDHKHRTM